MNILLRPIITEKSMLLASRGVFTFQVDLNATKHQVKSAVETTFKVNVTGVSTVRVKKEGRRTGRKRIMSASTSEKYARVSLKTGQSIDLFDLKEEN